MTNPYRAFRQLERKVFRGVPEQPEPLLQRDINAQVPERLTGRSQLGNGLPPDILEGARLVATVVYRLDEREVSYERASTDSERAE